MTEDFEEKKPEEEAASVSEETEEIADEFNSVKHSVKHKQTERKIRKKRKRINRMKAFLRFVVLIMLIAASWYFFKLRGWYLPADTFTNPSNGRVEIVNNRIIPTRVITRYLEDINVAHLPIFMMKVEPIKKEIYKIPTIKYVLVRRYGYPARIQIIIKERQPVATIRREPNTRPMAFFTEDEILIREKQYMNLKDYDDVLQILITPQDLKYNLPLKRIREIRKIVKEVETYSGEKAEYIDVRNPNDVYVKIKTANLRLGTPDSTVYERIKRIYTILPQITESREDIKYIDLSWDKVNYLKMNKPKSK